MSHIGSDCKDNWDGGQKTTCHNIGDIGGEMYLKARGNLITADHFWSFPITDIINVYNIVDQSKYFINPWKLRGCLLLMYLGRHLEYIVSEVAY